MGIRYSLPTKGSERRLYCWSGLAPHALRSETPPAHQWDGADEYPRYPPWEKRAVGHYLCQGDSKDNYFALLQALLFPCKECISHQIHQL
jgi:hypothetical protein